MSVGAPMALVLLGATALPAATHAMDCLPMASVALTVRIGSEPPTAALLQGGIETPLQLVDAESGRLLWSAGDTAHVIQRFAGLDAAIAGGITALDLDADGLHDRIYAADLSARIWRFDLQHGHAADAWAAGSLFADFSNAQGRGFVAAPDVSLSRPAQGAPWFNIAIGTASPGNRSANNRFYALRDPFVHAATEAPRPDPIREADLKRVSAALPSGTSPGTQADPDRSDPVGPGWYMELGGGHVLTPTLTVQQRAVLVIARTWPREGSCEVFVRIATLDLPAQRVMRTPEQDGWSQDMPEPVPVNASLAVQAATAGTAPCMLGPLRVHACDVDTRPRRTWWRREDAP